VTCAVENHEMKEFTNLILFVIIWNTLYEIIFNAIYHNMQYNQAVFILVVIVKMLRCSVGT